VRHRLGLATRTQISVCKSPFPSAGTAVSLFRAKTVQQRQLLPSRSLKKYHGYYSFLFACYSNYGRFDTFHDRERHPVRQPHTAPRQQPRYAVSLGCNRTANIQTAKPPLTLYGHIKTAEQRTTTQQYGDWYTSRWWVRLLHLVQRGGAWASSPIIAVLNVTAQRPVYQLRIIRCGTIIAYVL